MTDAQQARALEWLHAAEAMGAKAARVLRCRWMIDDARGAARLALCQAIQADDARQGHKADFRLTLWFAVRLAVRRERQRMLGGPVHARMRSEAEVIVGSPIASQTDPWPEVEAVATLRDLGAAVGEPGATMLAARYEGHGNAEAASRAGVTIDVGKHALRRARAVYRSFAELAEAVA